MLFRKAANLNLQPQLPGCRGSFPINLSVKPRFHQLHFSIVAVIMIAAARLRLSVSLDLDSDSDQRDSDVVLPTLKSRGARPTAAASRRSPAVRERRAGA